MNYKSHSTTVSLLIGPLLLAACSDAQPENHSRNSIDSIEPVTSESAPENQFGFVEAMEAGSPDPFGADAPDARMIAASTTTVQRSNQSSSSNAAQTDQSAQQIAYSYGFGFRVDGENVAKLQQAHIGICEEMGTSCRIIRTSQASSDSWDAYGELQLQVDATKAGSLDQTLAKPAEQLGGKLVSSVRDGEDLAEQIIDTEARLQSRTLLREKLTDILRNNRGSVDELVKAERAVAEINEEIDSTRSKLERFRNRIRFSDVRIEYEPGFGQSQIGFTQPVVTSIRSIGSTLGMTIAVLIYGLTALIPIILLILAVRWLLHKFGLRLRFWRKERRPTIVETQPTSEA